MGRNVKSAAGLQRIAILVVMAMALLFNNNQASAFSVITTGNSSGSLNCSGSMQECLIIDDANLVFFADQKSPPIKPGDVAKMTGKGGKPVIDCGKGDPYTSCLPGKNPKPPIGEHCVYPQTLNRVCKP